MRPFRLCLLGRFSLRRETGRIERPVSRRQQALLALVALDEQTVDRSKLAGTLWADKDEHQARQNLRQLLLNFKSALGEDSIILKLNRTSAWLDRSLVQVDVRQFLQLASNEDLSSLEAAASLYEGDLLPSFELGDELFDTWIAEKRDSIRRRATDVLRQLSVCLASESRSGASLAAAERLLDIDPWNEAHLRFLLTQIASLRGLRHAVDYASDAERRWRREFGFTFQEPTRHLVNDLMVSLRSVPTVAAMRLGSGPSIGGGSLEPLEQKFVTVLVASFAGEIEMLSADPEEAHDLATVAVEHMSGIVRSHGGTIASVVGDRVVAIFGAPSAYADHSALCSLASLKIRSEALASLKRWSIGPRVVDAFRAGIHSGDVIVKNGRTGVNLFAVGQSMQIAERLHNLANHGQILISTTALDLARYRHDCAVSAVNHGEFDASPTTMSELLTIQQKRIDFADSKRRGLSVLVGRAKELAVLSELIKRAQSGWPQFVCIEGETGVGKSRICWEAIEACRQNRWKFFEARTVDEAERRPPFEPVVQLIREVFELGPHDNADIAIGKIATLGVSILGHARRAILSLLGIEEPDTKWDSLSQLERRQYVTKVILDILSSMGKSRSTFILIEDAHRMSAEAQEIFTLMAKLTFRASLIVMVVGQHQREKHETPWSERLIIEPLAAHEAHTLLESLLKDRSGGFSDKVKSEIISRTGGNPLFIEHYVERLIDHSSDALQLRLDGTTVNEPPELPIPTTLRSLIQERIDQLNVGDKRLLQAAASIGIEGETELLADIASRSGSEVSASLSRLEEAKLIHTKVGASPVFRFNSGVVQEVAYGGVMSGRRTELNTAILRSLERSFTGRHESPWERLAHHASRAALWREAMKYHREAAHQSVRMSAMSVARLHYELALAALAQLPTEPDLEEQGVRLRLDLRIPLFAMSDQAAIQETLTDAYSVAIRLRQRKLTDRIEAYMVALYMARGDFDRSIEFSRRGARSLDPSVRAPGLANWASNLLQVSDFRSAVRKSREALRIIPADQIYEPFGQVLLPAVYALSNTAISCAELGRFAEGESAGKKAVEIANGNRRSYADMIFAQIGLGRVYVRQGQLGMAMPILQHALSLAREHELVHFLPTVAPVLGVAYLLSDEPEAALQLLEPVAAFCESKGMRNMFAFVTIVLAESCIALADNARAQYYLGKALQIANAQKQIGYIALALKADGDIARQTDSEPAYKAYKSALTLAESCGMRPLVAHLHNALSQICSERGSLNESQTHLESAKSLYTAMKMRFWMRGN